MSIHLVVPSERITVNRAELDGMVMVCEKALAEPPRNCDVGKPEEQYKRHEKLCDNTACIDCPVHEKFDFKQASCWSCQLVWAQMPYNESEAKA